MRKAWTGQPLTRFRFGLDFFAAGEALRVEAARIAPALSLLTPSDFAILLCTALNPG